MLRDLYFDDFAKGQQFETRGCTLSEAQILAFAFEHDPQPFHIDRIEAESGPYGGIIASGFQTLLVSFRLVCQERILNAASMGSPGMDELRWLRPVRPGDTIRARGEIMETRPSSSRPDRGSAVIRYEVTNQNGETVMTLRITHILRRQPETPAGE